MFVCIYVSFKYKWLINLNYISTSVYVFIGLGKTLKPDILGRTRAHLNSQTGQGAGWKRKLVREC